MTEPNGQDDAALANAGKIIDRFGGIRPMAAKMDVPVTTVQGWKKRDVIPGDRRDDVLRAARGNGIDLSDILKGPGAVNQNSPIFGKAVADAARDESPEKKAHHEAAVAAGDMVAQQDEIIRKLEKAERRAVQKSSIISFILFSAAMGFVAFVLWPVQGQVSDHARRIAFLENGMASVREDQSFLRNLVPDDLGVKFSELKTIAEDLADRVFMISGLVDDLSANVIGPDAGTISDRMTALEARVEALTGSPEIGVFFAKLREMQGTIDGQKQIAASVADLNAVVGNIQGRMDALDSELEQAQQEPDDLGRTLEGVSQADLKAAAMLVTLAQLRQSMNRSAPFAEDLDLLQKMAAQDDPELNEAIARLAPQAEKGILSPEGLKGEFKGLAGDIVVSSLKGEDVSVGEKARARLNEVLKVQKDGEMVTGTDTQAAVARAQKMLDEGNIAGALAELKTLEGEAAVTAQPWMERAEVTLMAQQVQNMITRKVAGRIGKSSLPVSESDIKALVRELKTLGGEGGVIQSPNSDFSIMP
ncbi:MAG: uroporphyrinogen III synthase HEM4 [Proteobacteria bacterium]|nr:uroporphyrinogen III synthase HEM4 [Pseudomonadota bacterium]